MSAKLQRAQDKLMGFHRRPRGVPPQDYPEWDKVAGVWKNAAGYPQPNFTGTREGIRVQQRREHKRGKRAAVAGPSGSSKRRAVADDMAVEPAPQPLPTEMVRPLVRLLSSLLSEDGAAHATFDLGDEYGLVRGQTSDLCGLVGARVALTNDQWPGGGQGTSNCVVVGYVDSLCFHESERREAGAAPACIVRHEGNDYAFRSAAYFKCVSHSFVCLCYR